MTDRLSSNRFPIRMTDEYGKFVFHAQNRILVDPVTGKNKVRKDLVQSMTDHGYRIEEPIKAYLNDNGTMTIIDGHNRLVAAQYLKLPVAYVCFSRNGATEWTPVDSSTARKWTLRERVSAFAHSGNEDYAEVLSFADKTGISLSQSCSMMYGQSAASGNAIKIAKEGKFKIKERDHAQRVAYMVDYCKMYIDWATNEKLVAAFSACLFAEKFSPVQMTEKIGKNYELLQKPPTLDAAMNMLDTIYNRNVNYRNRYELAVEVKNIMRIRQSRKPK